MIAGEDIYAGKIVCTGPDGLIYVAEAASYRKRVFYDRLWPLKLLYKPKWTYPTAGRAITDTRKGEIVKVVDVP